jgi:hypothetical protein
MNAATKKGALRIAEKTNATGQRPLISILRSNMVST